eukprot:9503328-Pyramimonas_sp.AAC.1
MGSDNPLYGRGLTRPVAGAARSEPGAAVDVSELQDPTGKAIQARFNNERKPPFQSHWQMQDAERKKQEKLHQHFSGFVDTKYATKSRLKHPRRRHCAYRVPGGVLAESAAAGSPVRGRSDRAQRIDGAGGQLQPGLLRPPIGGRLPRLPLDPLAQVSPPIPPPCPSVS